MVRFAHFFIDRPIFAAVLSILVTLAGAIVQRGLPISEYPEIAPPTVSISATYPGASAEVVASTVATPIEQEVNGVDDMLYISSQSTGDGRVTINVVFKPGTNVDQAQVLVQNRVSAAEPRLPEEVRRLGLQVRKASPDMMMVIHLTSPDGSRDQQYISNYMNLYVRDELLRIDGVGNATVFGARDYAMRIWLDPAQIAARSLTAGEVVSALRAANLQVAAGAINQPPASSSGAFQLSVQTLGRLSDVEEFANIVVRADQGGGVVRVRDIARVELGSQDYSINAYLNNKNAVAIGVFQRPGSNALATSDAVKAAMERLAASFPPGVAYSIVYNPTEFIGESVKEVIKTLIEAVILVILVVILFLQTWRAALIPILAIPVSLVGTFVVMGLAASPSTRSRSSGWCSPSASWSTTPSSWWRMSNGISTRACRRRRPPTRRWTRSAARSSPSRSCCAPSSSRPPSSPACRGRSTGSSRSPSRPRRRSRPSSP